MNKAKYVSKQPRIEMLFEKTVSELQELVEKANKGTTGSEMAIDKFSTKFCNDHVKCKKVFPVCPVLMFITAKTCDDVKFKYSVCSSMVHSWKP